MFKKNLWSPLHDDASRPCTRYRCGIRSSETSPPLPPLPASAPASLLQACPPPTSLGIAAASPRAFTCSIYPPSHPHLAWPAKSAISPASPQKPSWLSSHGLRTGMAWCLAPWVLTMVILSTPTPPPVILIVGSSYSFPWDASPGSGEDAGWLLGSVGEQLKRQLPGHRPCVRPGGPPKQEQNHVLDQSSVREPQGQPTAEPSWHLRRVTGVHGNPRPPATS